MTLSLVWGSFESKDGILKTLVRKKEKKLKYKYYPVKIYWNQDPQKIYFHIQDKLYLEGERMYINDIKSQHICLGIKDQRYQIRQVS